MTGYSGDFVGRYRVNPNTGRFQTTALPAGTYTLAPEVSPVFVPVALTSSCRARAPEAVGDTDSDVGTLRRAGGRTDGSEVTIADSDVDVELGVIDGGFDRIFGDDFDQPES